MIEVNGRLGGHLNELSRRACGVDLVGRAGPDRPRPGTAGAFADDSRGALPVNSLAPVEPCTLRALHGAKEARAVPGVHGHRPYVRPGGRLPGGIGTTHLDLLWGAAADHDAMVRTVQAALSCLSHEFGFDNDSVRTIHPRLTPPHPAPLCGPTRPGHHP